MVKTSSPYHNTSSEDNWHNTFYSTYDNRISSMFKAPSFIKYNAHTIAEAGLFYIETKKALQCYNCSLQIHEMVPSDNPNYIHWTTSPNCKRLRTTSSFTTDTTQLASLIRNNNHPLHALIVFQAVTRLRHYSLFPFMDIHDSLIDQDTTNLWHNQLHSQIRETYTTIVENSIKVPQQFRKPILFPVSLPDSPYHWYRRSLILKSWNNDTTSNTEPDHKTLNTWVQMNEEQRKPYIKLSWADHKLYATRRIEEVFATQGLTIGILRPYTTNITVLPSNENNNVAPLSYWLHHKMSALSNTEN